MPTVTLSYQDADWPHVVAYCADRAGIPEPTDVDGQIEVVAAVQLADGLAGAASLYQQRQVAPLPPVQPAFESAQQAIAALRDRVSGGQAQPAAG